MRTYALGNAEAVHPVLDDAYRGRDPSYVPLAHGDWVRAMTGDSEFDATTWWRAERNGDLAGCAFWWSSGWLNDLAVREGERGRGLGAALVRRGLAGFARRGRRRAGLKVDAANPTGALALSERLGYELERKEQVWALSL